MSFFITIDNFDEELEDLTPAQRWERVLQPLAEALEREELGSVVDLDSLIVQTNDGPGVIASEVCLEVTDMKRAKELVREIEKRAQGNP
jgi:hypothetical protein